MSLDRGPEPDLAVDLAMLELLIRHLPGTDPPGFEILHPGGEKTVASIPAADRFAVEGRPDSHLARELRWYLETYPDYPFSPATERAQRVMQALKRWRAEVRGTLRHATTERLLSRRADTPLTVKLESCDTRVLSWPWESLFAPHDEDLNQRLTVERQLALPAALPSTRRHISDKLRILLVIARPEADVAYRSVARPLLELIEEHECAAALHVLRPPTFKRLKEHLTRRPDTYHVLHLDGHGVYDAGSRTRPEGHLVFERENGGADVVSARLLGKLMRTNTIPIAVLNSCQSAMLDESAANAFASVATALNRSGVFSSSGKGPPQPSYPCPSMTGSSIVL